MLRERGHAHVQHPCPQLSVGDSLRLDQRGNVQKDPNSEAVKVTASHVPHPRQLLLNAAAILPPAPLPQGSVSKQANYPHRSLGSCTTHLHLEDKFT